MWDYTNKVREYFLNPRNVGEIEDADTVAEIGNITCGDALKLYLKIDENSRITDAKFKTFGCASAIASSSALTEMIIGKTIDEALAITNKDIADYLGGLPEEKMHCSVMGQEALEKAIKIYRGESIEEDKDEDHHGKIVCKCFNVTDTKIKRVVMENNLKTIADVTHYCKAGGACQSCHNDIQEILDKIHNIKGEKNKEVHDAKKTRVLTNLQKIQLVQETINNTIKPYLHHDGGDIELVDIDGNDVYCKLKGSCAVCPAAGQTLKNYVERTLRDQVIQDLNVIEVK